MVLRGIKDYLEQRLRWNYMELILEKALASMESHNMFEYLKHFPIEFVYGGIAVCGGIARYLNHIITGERFSFGILLASAFVAGFSGYMFATLGQSMNFSQPLLFVSAGVGGFFGEQTMKYILEVMTRRTDLVK